MIKGTIIIGFRLKLGVLLLSLSCCSLLQAQSKADDQNKLKTLEVIEVTAQKHLQSIQEIPISITAIGRQTLESASIHQASDVTTLLPNVNATRSISGLSNYFIRGVGMDGFNLTAVPAVGLYVDDVAIINPALANFALFDIQRVEVLKGPQNTLYGKNTTGGAINFITQGIQADQDTTAYAQLSVGQHNQLFLTTAASTSLTDRLGVRLAVFSQQRDGLVSSEVEGNQTSYNDRNQYGARLKLAYQINPDMTLLASLYGGKQNQIAEVKTAIAPLGDNNIIDLSEHDLSKNHSALIDPPHNIDTLGGYLKFNLQQSTYRFTAISAFEHLESKRMDDWGSQQLPSAVYQANTYNTTDTESYSQEFQWQSTTSSPLQWIAGLLFNAEQGDLLQTALIDPAGPGRPDDSLVDAGIGPMFDRGAWVEHKSRSYSAYSQYTYAWSDTLNFSAGLRWTQQQLTPTVNSVGMMMDLPGQEFPLGSLGWLSLGNNDFERFSEHMGFEQAQRFILANGGFPASAKIDETFNEWGGKLAVDYQLNPQMMLYGSLSRGFKMGTVNSNPTTTAYVGLLDKVVKPETLITTELGIKTDLLDRTLRVNAAIFNNQWQNYQFFLVYNPGNPADLFASLINLPEAESKGAELDITWQASASLRLNFAIAWLNSQVIDGQLDTTGIPEQNVANFQSQAIKGNSLTNAPNSTYTIAAHKSFQFNQSDIELSLYYSYLGKHIHQLAGEHNATWVQNFSEESTGLLSGNVAFAFGQHRQYQVAIWAKNLTNEAYCSERAIAPGAAPDTIRLCAQGESRSVGLTAKLIF